MKNNRCVPQWHLKKNYTDWLSHDFQNDFQILPFLFQCWITFIFWFISPRLFRAYKFRPLLKLYLPNVYKQYPSKAQFLVAYQYKRKISSKWNDDIAIPYFKFPNRYCNPLYIFLYFNLNQDGNALKNGVKPVHIYLFSMLVEQSQIQALNILCKGFYFEMYS